MSSFDIKRFKNIRAKNFRFPKQIARMKDSGINTSCIEDAIAQATDRLGRGISSFVIYGEPQSGKTEMMIALTAKLLDEGKKIIVVLLNDNVELLKQNLRRFQSRGLDPCPKNFDEVINPTVVIGNNEWIIFCKKNANNLRNLIEKLRSTKERVIIDDEADYASPNARINKGEVTKINGLVGRLLGSDGTYIGVTATPARLDVNNTFDNANDEWVNFPPHENYTGQDIFFPINLDETLKYKLSLLADYGDDPKHLRNALFSFFVTVAHLNTHLEQHEKNYCMLIHTSGKKDDHASDYKQVVKVIEALKDQSHKHFEVYARALWEKADKRYGEGAANEIVEYILRTVSRSTVKVLNSSRDNKCVDNEIATNPQVPFTIAIGGNIVSRGVTFKNLVSMFFTRDVKHKIQQDTYIQRARMFGARNEYVEHFELSIPEPLFFDWHRCFVFHRLALESIKRGKIVPVWLEDRRISAVSASSVDKTTVTMDSGEMSFEMFDYDPAIEPLIESAYSGKKPSLKALRELHEKLGKNHFPEYLLSYIENTVPKGDRSVAIHKSFLLNNYKSADEKNISRPRGFIGTGELEQKKFPNAMHHFKLIFNKQGKARLFYKYVGSIKFLKNLKRYSNEL